MYVNLGLTYFETTSTNQEILPGYGKKPSRDLSSFLQPMGIVKGAWNDYKVGRKIRKLHSHVMKEGYWGVRPSKEGIEMGKSWWPPQIVGEEYRVTWTFQEKGQSEVKTFEGEMGFVPEHGKF